MSEFIKNPNRNRPQVIKPYVPEYITLGKTPKQLEAFNSTEALSELVSTPPKLKRDPNAEEFASLDDITFAEDSMFPNMVNISNREPQPELNSMFDDITEIDRITVVDNYQPAVGQYMLLVNGQTVLVDDDIENIENKIKKIAYEEDEDFTSKVEMDDIVVLKRIGIKVGIFLDK